MISTDLSIMLHALSGRQYILRGEPACILANARRWSLFGANT
jgi:hypothetical protein